MLLLDGSPSPLWQLWLVVAVLPALAEELFFRGFLMAGFRKLGAVPAIAITALLFAFAHSSIYRLAPTLLIGVLLGVIVWRTGSIVCGIVAHTLNNGLMITLVSRPNLIAPFAGEGTPYLPWSVVAAGGLVTLLGVWLLVGRRVGRRQPNGDAAQPRVQLAPGDARLGG